VLAPHNLPVGRNRDLPCPCRAREATPARYADCCGHWHDALPHGEHAPTPEALMRSRYSAYALAQGHGPAPPAMLEYLMQTWHPSTAPGDLELGRLAPEGLIRLATAPPRESRLPVVTFEPRRD
jgi:uncharacterized protein YchJ